MVYHVLRFKHVTDNSKHILQNQKILSYFFILNLVLLYRETLKDSFLCLIECALFAMA